MNKRNGFTLINGLIVVAIIGIIAGCVENGDSVESRDAARVQQQQSQYEKGQPIPAFDWSLERHLVIELYRVRNQKVATHSVWRSDHGIIEGDCPSYGYGIPYDTSLTNPLVATDIDMQGEEHAYQGGALASIEQAEPNGVFASKNTAATWVMCLGEAGTIEPVYVETKVTVYPGPVLVDYERNRVTRSGAATVLINTN
jgi:type II secretory pathway pseudopilin PulG